MLATNSQPIFTQFSKSDLTFLPTLYRNGNSLSTVRSFEMWLKICSCFLFVVVILTGLTLLDLIMCKNVREEQCVIIKFLVAEGATPIQIWGRLVTVYGEESLGKTQVRMWCKRFKDGDGHEPVSDLPRSGRPRTAIIKRTIDRVQ